MYINVQLTIPAANKRNEIEKVGYLFLIELSADKALVKVISFAQILLITD